MGSNFVEQSTSSVMNNDNTTGYVKLNGGIRQGDLLFAYLFALATEVLFINDKKQRRY